MLGLGEGPALPPALATSSLPFPKLENLLSLVWVPLSILWGLSLPSQGMLSHSLCFLTPHHPSLTSSRLTPGISPTGAYFS